MPPCLVLLWNKSCQSHYFERNFCCDQGQLEETKSFFVIAQVGLWPTFLFPGRKKKKKRISEKACESARCSTGRRAVLGRPVVSIAPKIRLGKGEGRRKLAARSKSPPTSWWGLFWAGCHLAEPSNEVVGWLLLWSNPSECSAIPPSRYLFHPGRGKQGNDKFVRVRVS